MAGYGDFEKAPSLRFVDISENTNRLSRDADWAPVIDIEQTAGGLLRRAFKFAESRVSGIAIYNIDAAEFVDSLRECSLYIRRWDHINLEDEQLVAGIFLREIGDGFWVSHCRDDLISLFEEVKKHCIAKAWGGDGRQ